MLEKLGATSLMLGYTETADVEDQRQRRYARERWNNQTRGNVGGHRVAA
jgi:hypothetical protein